MSPTFKTMENKIIENDIKMKEMAEKYKDEYFELFGSLILNGYDIQSAIDFCYNKLILNVK